MSPADTGGDRRLQLARELYERAVFGGDLGALATAERHLDGVEADLALARGRIMHARYLAERHDEPRELQQFERAAKLYGQLGDVRGEAEALFWIGTYHQVVRGNHEAAVAALLQSRDLAVAAGDKLTLSYAVRHLGFADAAAGRTAAAREQLEESVRLRREIGFMPGVAAGLLALAELATTDGNQDEAAGLLDEAARIAHGSGAKGILRWIEQAREGRD